MSSPYSYTHAKKKPQKQVKFWVVPEFAESLKWMAPSYSSSGVHETLVFLHWEIIHLQHTVDLLKPWVFNILATICLIQRGDNYATTYNYLFIILQKHTNWEDKLLFGEIRKSVPGSQVPVDTGAPSERGLGSEGEQGGLDRVTGAPA